MDFSKISKWCLEKTLPDTSEFYNTILEDDGTFASTEGLQWDFKDAWPYSLSDDYFGGIARLICAFSNTVGGIIIFGVHDTKRTGGHNKVKINFDRFSLALQQLFRGKLPPLLLRPYTSESAGNVDVLLVGRRPSGISPYRFQKTIGKYRVGQIWMRVGHEVKRVEPSLYPILFCRACSPIDSQDISPLDGIIPPNPATLKQRFVGRAEVLDQLFSWLETSDEPRTYLYGKGGSGKTTIAYEFTRLIKEYGANLTIYGRDKLDCVVFVSAKEKSLLVSEGRVIDIDKDFSNEKQLLEVILHSGGWISDESYLNKATTNELREELKDFLDLCSVLLVVDDIDTLTTKGIDPGSDFLYRTLCRAKRQSKVLYTLRNVPSQSLVNSIEVPGLRDDEYSKFVAECVEHFKVPEPSAAFINDTLRKLSEQRPLVIESVIALRRTSGSYDCAADLFKRQTGDAIRDYVFMREWDALRSEQSKLLLVALSEFKKTPSFSDLKTVLRFEPSIINDAIGEVREMFLQVNDAGCDTLYTLAPLTRSFVISKKTQIFGYKELRERIKTFEHDISISNPQVANISSQVDRLLPSRFATHASDKVRDAFTIVNNKNLPVSVTQNPFYKTILGYVLICFSPAKLGEARDAFEYAFSMRFEPDYKYLRSWLIAERNSGIHIEWCIRIADYVLNGRKYDQRDKMEMMRHKTSSLYHRAIERINTDVSESLKDMTECLHLHLRGFRIYCNEADFHADASEKYARSTAFQLFDVYRRSLKPWEFLDVVESIVKHDNVYVDPIHDPIIETVADIVKKTLRMDELQRTRRRIHDVLLIVSEQKFWLSSSEREKFEFSLREIEDKIDEKFRQIKKVNVL